MFPCRPAPDKSPLTRKGFKDATTDPARVNAFWNANPGASIGVPAGRESGFWVFDVDLDPAKGIDGYLALDDLEKEHGRLPLTFTVGTPRGGQHRYFLLPEGLDVTNSPGGLPEGLDVRGQGGYVLVPPSPGYKIQRKAPIAEAPGWLLDLILSRRRDGGEQVKKGRPRAQAIPNGNPIPEGERNSTLFFWALARKDEGRAPDEVLGLLLTENDARCTPPLSAEEVEKIARSACRYPLRGRKTPPEVLAVVRELEKLWWATAWRGVGGKTERDVLRVLIEFARRYGIVVEDGVQVSISVRTLALASATHYVTVSKVLGRLRTREMLRKSDSPRVGTDAASWVLLTPRPTTNTRNTGGARGGDPGCLSVSTLSERSLEDLQTPCVRWRGLIGKGLAGVLYALEGFGWQSREELADRLGWKNPRELELRYLLPLVELGLIKEEGGVYSLYDDHRERVEEVRRARYTTVRRKKRWSHDGPRKVVWIEESVRWLSEVEREEKDRQRHEEHRRRFREHRQKLYEAKRGEALEELERQRTELLNRMDEERGSGWVEEAAPVEVAWPEVVDGVVQHDPECGCGLCADEPEAVA